ncbi:MAG: ribonuclease III [Gammaproteobacteria bacterium]|nr:ribonuclease III [Gammaproteobacteria bacterium]
MSGELALLQEKLGHRFCDPELLELALTHRSRGSRNNERLEFLGDSILNHIIAQALYQQFENSREGELSRMRAALVKGETLAEVARELDLGSVVRLGPGEMKSGGRRRDSILADTLEAVIGAVLLDSDVSSCRDRVLQLFDTRLRELSPQRLAKDAKTQLQEFLQGRGKALPAYQMLAIHGEDHQPHFKVSCELPEFDLSLCGEGSSRRRAEQEAARLTLASLEQRG